MSKTKELQVKINEFINESLKYLEKTENTGYIDDFNYPYPVFRENESNEKLAYILTNGDIALLNNILDKAIEEEEENNK